MLTTFCGTDGLVMWIIDNFLSWSTFLFYVHLLTNFSMMQEKARNDLLLKELKVQEVIWATKASQLEEIIKESKREIECLDVQLKRKSEELLESNAALREANEINETNLKEKEESNLLLRKDLLALMSQYNLEKEKSDLESAKQKNEVSRLKAELVLAYDDNERLKSELQSAVDKGEKTRKSKKKIQKEMNKLQQEAKEIYRHNERGIRMSKMMEHIDNID